MTTIAQSRPHRHLLQVSRATSASVSNYRYSLCSADRFLSLFPTSGLLPFCSNTQLSTLALRFGLRFIPASEDDIYVCSLFLMFWVWYFTWYRTMV